MKKLSVVLFVFTFYFLLFTCGDAVAAVPGKVNYQGKLTTSSGKLIADGQYKMVFKLYQNNSALVWTETFDGAAKVQVTAGLFNVLLGTGSNDGDLGTIFRDNDNLYLGVAVNNGSEMTPRLHFVSVGYALKSEESVYGNPVGMIQLYVGSSVPAGWLLCDGAAVSRTTYSALFAEIGTVYGAGDGSTTFNLPSLKDRFAMGKSGTRSLGTAGGAETIDLSHSHTVDSHNHSISTASLNHRHPFSFSVSGGSHTHNINTNIFSLIGDTTDKCKDGSTSTVGSEGHGHNLNIAVGGGSHSHSFSGNTGYADLSHAHGGATGSASPGTNSRLSSAQSILPPYQVMNYIIKY